MRKVVVLMLVGFAAAAAADEPAGSDYRYQVVVADATSWGVLLAGFAARSPALAGFGTGGMVLAAPIIHGINGDETGAWESLALRVGLSTAGAFIGFAAARDPAHDAYGTNGAAGMALGALAGMVTAQILDCTLIGGRSRVHSRENQRSAFSFEPTLAATPFGAQIGAVGTF